MALEHYAAAEAAAQAAANSPKQQLKNFAGDLNATLGAAKSQSNCILDVTEAFWDGGNYQGINCGLLGHATYKQKNGVLVWTPFSGSGATTHVVCDRYTDCSATGSAMLSGPSGHESMLSTRLSVNGPSVKLSLAAAGGGGGDEGPSAPGGENWPVQTLRNDCTACVNTIQAQIGGEVRTIRPQAGFQWLGPSTNNPGDAWQYHDVVVQNGRVYDSFTGPGGLTRKST